MRHITSIEIRRNVARRRPGLVASEFFLDGRLLLEHCERSARKSFDLISPVGWTFPDYQAAFAERLLLRQPAVLPSDRRELLVCPECADLGCGCISADVTSDGENFVWGEVGYENDYDPDILMIFPMGRFVIPKTELLHQLRGHVPGL